MSLFKLMRTFLQAMLSSRTRLAAEDLDLRQQLAALHRSVMRPRPPR